MGNPSGNHFGARLSPASSNATIAVATKSAGNPMCHLGSASASRTARLDCPRAFAASRGGVREWAVLGRLNQSRDSGSPNSSLIS